MYCMSNLQWLPYTIAMPFFYSIVKSSFFKLYNYVKGDESSFKTKIKSGFDFYSKERMGHKAMLFYQHPARNPAWYTFKKPL